MTTISGLDVGVYRFPTDTPEADGTLQWDSTTAITVSLHAGGTTGLGWTYGSPAVAEVITAHLSGVVCDRDAGDVTGGFSAMRRACRNFGTRGLVGQAISAVDLAWWDLAARLLDAPLTRLLGAGPGSVPVYGSGGFTTFSDEQLADQVAGWAAAGCDHMKIKIGESWGSRIDRDLDRVRQLRELAGAGVALMVDANGGYTAGQARRVGAELDELGVVWFEEPVSSDDLAGLAELRTALRCDVTAGEYAADIFEARQLLPVVDCLQLDVTRCGGYTGWRAGAALAAAANVQVSAHCAPAQSAYACAAVPNARHIEWFADHAALEPLLVDGVPQVRDGAIALDDAVTGHGMTIAAGAAKYRV